MIRIRLETPFLATFWEWVKALLVTICLILNIQICNFCYTICPARPHIFCAPSSNLLLPVLTSKITLFVPCLSSTREPFVHIFTLLYCKSSSEKNILFGRYVESSMLFLVILPHRYHPRHTVRLTFQRACDILKQKRR